MELRMEKADIRAVLHRQLLSFFPLDEDEIELIDAFLEEALARCGRCFSKVRNKYYNHGGVTRFDPLHGCQWAAFLYFLSNSIYHAGGGLMRYATRYTRRPRRCRRPTSSIKSSCPTYSHSTIRWEASWAGHRIRTTSASDKGVPSATTRAYTPLLGSRCSC